MTFDLWAGTRVYRMPLDDEDRAMAAGAPLLLRDDDGAAPALTGLATSVAIAVAMRDVGGGYRAAFRHEAPAHRAADGPSR